MEANEEPLELFLSCLTQWRTNLFGQPLGLDYRAVYSVAGSLDIRIDRVILNKIQLLEDDVVFGDEHNIVTGKPCRHADACAICSKKCSERIKS